MSKLKANIVANLVGGAWVSLLSFLFIPFYLRYLGIEAYGLVGFFITFQAVFAILDMGISSTLTRGMARLSVGQSATRDQRDYVRTFELIYWFVALAAGVAVLSAASAIAERWLTAESLATAEVTAAVRMMAIVCALQFPFLLYRAGLLGLQRQVAANGLSIVFGTIRSGGAVLALALIAPTVEVFFAWQALTALLQTVCSAAVLWRGIPGAAPARFRFQMVRAEWRFAATVSANAVIGVLLTQTDKILLSRFLTLEHFGYYMLASSVASALWTVIVPVNTAIYPRMAQLIELRQTEVLRDLYHATCQFVSVLILPLSAVLIMFSGAVLFAWTGDPAVVRGATILSLLVGGTCLNAIASVAAYLQAAAGWPQLTMLTNLAAAIVLVPAIIFVAPRFGGTGTAMVWLALNSSYVLVTVPIMHRRLLVGELQRWYVEDVLFPATAVFAVGVLARLLMPGNLGRIAVAVYLSLTLLLTFGAALLSAPGVRTYLLRLRSHLRQADAL